MIEGFVRSLNPDFLLCSKQELQFYTGKSPIFCRELSFGLYSQVPDSCTEYVNVERYQNYRLETRQKFGAEFDFPVFTTFTDLVEYFGTTKQSLARALCLQRSLMDRYDRSRVAQIEVMSAIAQTMGPEFCAMLGHGLTVVIPQVTDLQPAEESSYTPWVNTA